MTVENDRNDAVRSLISEMKDQARAWAVLKRTAREEPGRILDYIEALPEAWRRVPSRGVDRLKELERIALRAEADNARRAASRRDG